MNVSEAIRIGSQKRAAAESGWNDLGPDGQIRSCPLFAAAEAYGLLVVEEDKIVRGPKWIEPEGADSPIERGDKPCSNISRIPNEWYAVLTAKEIPPCSCAKYDIPDYIQVLVVHLYDMHKWTREQVADWIEGVEMRVDEKQWIAAKGPGIPWKPGVKW